MSTLRAHPLRHTLYFTQEELALNREGRLSERQVNRRADEDRKTRRNMQRIAAGLAAVGGVALFFMEVSMAFIVFLMAGGLYLAARRFVRPGADVQAQQCHAVEGYVELHVRKSYKGPDAPTAEKKEYWLRLHSKPSKSDNSDRSATAPKEEFRISKRAWEAFMEDTIYRVYYADTKVVAAEPK